MKKRIRAIIALCLAMMMLAACGSTNTQSSKEESKQTSTSQSTATSTSTSTEVVEESKYPEYLNLDGYRPIVKEGEEITITIASKRDQSAETPSEDTWLYKFIEEKFNINLEVEWLTDTERKSIIFASGDLPDIMVDIGISGTDVANYGIRDGMLLNLLDYVSEDLTPNLYAVTQDYAQYMDYYTSDNGAMYGVPIIADVNRYGYGDTVPLYRTFISKKYMDATGWEKVPETLDEVLEFCRDVKALDPATMGVEEIWPIADQYNYLWSYLQTAFGFVTDNWASYVTALWDADQGKVIVPCMDDKFEPYIKLFNTLYEEGLVHPDFLTMDSNTSKAMMAAGQVAICATSAPSVYSYGGGTAEDWVAAAPLTSEYNAEAVACCSSVCGGPYLYVSADTEYPEVILRLIDWICSEEGMVYIEYGAPNGSEDTMGMMEGFVKNEETGGLSYPEVVSGEYSSGSVFRNNVVTFMKHNIGFRNESVLRGREMLGEENPQFYPAKATHDGTMLANACKGKLMQPLKSVVMNDEQRAVYTDLRSAVNAYVKGEVAKFIVGQRDFSEFDKFREEIVAAGGDKYEKLLLDYYEGQEEPNRTTY